MESPPYNLRLCFSERDFLGGGCYLQTAAVAIEKRCRKFVAVLSSNFDDSEGAIYESHIAMSLSPGQIKMAAWETMEGQAGFILAAVFFFLLFFFFSFQFFFCNITGCKESQFYSLPFGQAVASMHQPTSHFNQSQNPF